MTSDSFATTGWTRRRFLQLALGGVALTAGCSDLGLETDTPLFDGPVINEQDFITLNANYYGSGIDASTQFPYRELRGNTIVRQTDPLPIAFRLQHLLTHTGNQEVVDSMLTHLLNAQISERPPNNFRNMLPRLIVDSDGLTPATKEYSFIDNAVLSARVAMAAQLFNGTPTGDKALSFLEKQKLGYNQALAQSSGLLTHFCPCRIIWG